MGKRTYLGELEQMVLWTVLRLGGKGYGATILEELSERVGRRVSTGALYATLDRLEAKEMLQSRLADAEAGRGGRRKRYMTVTPEGRLALAQVQQDWRLLWDSMDAALEPHEQ